MKDLVEDWIGKTVKVLLNAPESGPLLLEGKLLRATESGVMIQQPRGPTAIPREAIIYLIPSE